MVPTMPVKAACGSRSLQSRRRVLDHHALFRLLPQTLGRREVTFRIRFAVRDLIGAHEDARHREVRVPDSQCRDGPYA
jgi:hypothetical protein